MKKIFLLLFWVCFLFAANSQVTQPPVSIEKLTAVLKAEAPNNLDTNIIIGINGKGPLKLAILNFPVPTGSLKNVKWLSGAEAVTKYSSKAAGGIFDIEMDKKAFAEEFAIIDNGTGDELKVFQKVEIEASFAGGDNAWRKYLEKNANSLVPVDLFAPPGVYTVIVEFVVNKDGNISDVKPLTNHGYGMENEVMRIIRKGPKWTPAMQGGRNVRAYRKQPVTFQVEGAYELSTYKLKPNTATIVDLKISGYSPEDLHVTVSNGRVKYVSGFSYEITAPKSGMVVFSVEAKVKRKTVDLGKIALRVE